MRMSAYDRWVTTEPSWRQASDLFEVPKEDMMGKPKDSDGPEVPVHVDELTCHECSVAVAWCSDGGCTTRSSPTTTRASTSAQIATKPSTSTPSNGRTK